MFSMENADFAIISVDRDNPINVTQTLLLTVFIV